MSIFIVVLVGVFGGLAGALQGQAVGFMDERSSVLVSTFVTYAGGGAAIALVMLIARGQGLSDLRGAPWWVYTAGLLGLVVIGTLGVLVSELGLGSGLTLFTAATIIIGALIEAVGIFGSGQPLDLRRVAGIGIVILGTWMVVGTSTSAS